MVDSSTGGYLAPNPPPDPTPLEDQALDEFLQQVVSLIVGLPGQMVRPRWQAEPPAQPAYNIDWAAIGITEFDPDTFVGIIHHPDGNGFNELQHQERMSLLCSFYGPNAGGNAKLLRDGLAISQNREVLFLSGMSLIEVGRPLAAPAFQNQRWTRKIDMTVTINRQIRRYYPILNVLGAPITILTTAGTTTPVPHNAEVPGGPR
jgi:hypothetical protein